MQGGGVVQAIVTARTARTALPRVYIGRQPSLAIRFRLSRHISYPEPSTIQPYPCPGLGDAQPFRGTT